VPVVYHLCETIRRLLEFKLIVEFESTLDELIYCLLFDVIVPCRSLLCQNASEDVLQVLVASDVSNDGEVPLEPFLVHV